MEEFEGISIRGRMAYMLCMFENVLLYYRVEKKEWRWILERLWQFTTVQFVDDWLYEIAEFMPDSVLNDTVQGLEFLTEDEFYSLRSIYTNTYEDVLYMIRIIFELGTLEMYSTIRDFSPNTLEKLGEGIEIMQRLGLELISIEPFKKYRFIEGHGWGKPFNGKEFSQFV